MDLKSELHRSLTIRFLDELVPKYWYNIVPDLPKPLPPYLKPDGTEIKPKELERIFARELVVQEFSN